MKILILSVILFTISISVIAQNYSLPESSAEQADTTLIKSEPLDSPNAIPIVTEKSATPVPAEIQLVEPESKLNTEIKEEE